MGAEIYLRRCRAHLAILRPYGPSPTPQQMKEAQIAVASSQKLYILNFDLNDFCIMHLRIQFLLHFLEHYLIKW